MEENVNAPNGYALNAPGIFIVDVDIFALEVLAVKIMIKMITINGTEINGIEIDGVMTEDMAEITNFSLKIKF